MPVTIRTGALNYKDPTTGEYVGINAVEDGSFSTIAPSYSTLTFPVAAGQLCYQNGSLFKAKDAIVTSETWTPAHWDEVTIAEELASKSSSGSVDDVQINGTSIVNNGTANIPIAGSSSGSLGVVKSAADYGTAVLSSTGILRTYPATSADIKEGIQAYRPIVSQTQHESAFYGLAKAAGDSTQSASANAVGTYTAGAKTAIQGMLDVPSTTDMQSTIIVGDDQPQQASNKLWVDTDSTLPEYQVPTVAEMNTALGNKVSDVQMNGTSIVSNGVANVPKANSSQLGVVKGQYYGIRINNDGDLYINLAGIAEIKPGQSNYLPIVPSNQHMSVFYGLSKAAGVDMASSSNAVGTYTDEAKVAIQKMLGVYESPWELIREDTFTNASQATHTISVDENGQSFELTSVVLMFETPTQATEAISNGNFVLSDGSNFLTSLYTNGWTQEPNAVSHGCWLIAENKGDLVFINIRSQTTSTSAYGGATMQGYSEGFQGLSQSIVEGNNFIVREVRIAQIKGTGHYKLYGRRKWT